MSDGLNNLTDDEIFENINEGLKKIEDITLPDALSPENMEEKLKKIDPFVPKSTQKAPKKRRFKKIFYSSVAAAVVFAVAVSSVTAIKLLHRTPSNVQGTNTSVTPLQIQNYSQIEDMFAQYHKNYEKYRALNEFKDVICGISMYGAKMESAVDEAVNDSASSSVQTTSGYGKTYEQVDGVSEADIIKNDGTYLYAVNYDDADWSLYYDMLYGVKEQTTAGGEVSGKEKTADGDLVQLDYNCSVDIIKAKSDGSFNERYVVEIAKPTDSKIYYMSLCEMYVSGNNLIVLGDCYKYTDNCKPEEDYYEDTRLTVAVSYDITDKTSPVEMWRIYQDGSYVSSRLIGDRLVVISDYTVNIYAEEDVVRNTCVPQIACGEGDMQRVNADHICVMPDVCDSRYIVASTLNTQDKTTLKTCAVLGAGSDVYCTEDTLYAVSAKYVPDSGVEEIFGASTLTTQIFKFDIRNYDVAYLCSASLQGSVLNQFSIDEYNGYLRIALTTDALNENQDEENYVYVLDEKLNTVGKTDAIAEGETVKAVRFAGNTAYVVTFEQTDPLFVLDMSNPQAPVVKGQVEIPGFSAYLHPINENLLLGVGQDGDDDGENGGMKISLFDVSNPENPVECDKITLNGNQTPNSSLVVSSEAFYTHKALCWDGENNIMYVPYAKYENAWSSYNGGTSYHKQTSGVLAVKVDESTKKISSSANYVSNSTDQVNAEEFTRATYIDGVLYGYSYSENIFTSFDTATQKQLYSVKIK